jgi:hypothetical protein
MNKIARVSRAIRMALWVVMILLPVIVALQWIFLEYFLDKEMFLPLGRVYLSTLPLYLPLSWGTKALGFLVSLIPLTMDMLVVGLLIRLFGRYARGDIFTEETVGGIRHIGYVLLLGQALSPVYQALLTLVLTLPNPPGDRLVSIGLGSSNVSAVLTGLMIIVVAWIMDEGRRLQEDQALVI